DMTWRKIAFGLDIYNENINKKKSMIHPRIFIEDFSKLPTFTWKEFNQRVQSGANFVVCDV
ncbi:19905_t:CDS:2, partial [Cetraspora pellucida]